MLVICSKRFSTDRRFGSDTVVHVDSSPPLETFEAWGTFFLVGPDADVRASKGETKSNMVFCGSAAGCGGSCWGWGGAGARGISAVRSIVS